MDDLLDILLEFIVDGAIDAVESKRTPLWARVLLTAVLLAFFLGLSGLLIGAGLSTGDWPLTVLGVLFLAGSVVMAVYKVRKRKRK